MAMDWVQNVGLSRKTNITLAYIVTTVWLAVTAIEKISDVRVQAAAVGLAMILTFVSHRRGRLMQFELDKKDAEDHRD